METMLAGFAPVNSKPFPRRKRLRLPHFDYAQPGFAYFLTLCVRDSQPLFNHDALAGQVTKILHNVRREYGVQVYAYCLMPDHFHIVMSLEKTAKAVPEVVRDFKKLTTQAAWDHGCQGSLWQRSFYDHVIRRNDDLELICRYVLENPVRAGLVEQTGEYPYSGAPDSCSA